MPMRFPSWRYPVLLSSLFFMAWLMACSQARPPARPMGQAKSAKTRVLEAGAALSQGNEPLDPMNIYLVGLHPMKDNPAMQMEAHHFCRQVNEDFAQCSLFDGNTETANLTGVEYIISQRLFDSLPEAERRYWHPHNYEILSGQLVAPRLADAAEKELMRKKMNSYGKTWHVWQTGAPGAPGDRLPMGEPMLAWSFNRDGEAKPELVREKDARTGIKTAEVREKRKDLTPMAAPQAGVDALKGKFPGNTISLPGVVDKDASARK